MTFGERLKQARERSGLNQYTLARLVSVERISISEFETGERLPSSSTLIALSSVLGVDVEYFFHDCAVSMQSCPLFLGVPGEKLSVSEKKQIVAETEEVFSRHLEVFDICEYSMPKPDAHLRRNVSSMKGIDDLTHEVRDAWDVGNDPIDNLMETVELHGFSVVLVRGTKGFGAVVFLDEPRGPVIAINEGVSRERQRFVLAHALGRYFVQNSGLGTNSRNLSICADLFAESFLVPKHMLRADVGDVRMSLDFCELDLLRDKYGVSVETLLYRMNSAGIISDKLMLDYQRAYCDGLVRSHSEMKDSEKPRLVRLLVYRKVAEGIISEQKGYELLGESGGISSPSLEAA